MGFAVKTHCSLYFEIPQNHRSDDYRTLINQDLRERNVARRDRERNTESNTGKRERERCRAIEVIF
jgi:hypothetical protein